MENGEYHIQINAPYEIFVVSSLEELDKRNYHLRLKNQLAQFIFRVKNTLSDEKHNFGIKIIPEKTTQDGFQRMLKDVSIEIIDLALNRKLDSEIPLDFDNSVIAETNLVRFHHMRSILENSEFLAAVESIKIMPRENLVDQQIVRNSSMGFHPSPAVLMQLVKGGSLRSKLPTDSFVSKKLGLETIPSRIALRSRNYTRNHPENQFVKHFLTSMRELLIIFRGTKGIERWCREKIYFIESIIAHPTFSELSPLSVAPSLIQALQRDSRYSLILKSWISMHLSAKLEAEFQNHSSGTIDAAKLYEYWVFFNLLDGLERDWNVSFTNKKKLFNWENHGVRITEGYSVENCVEISDIPVIMSLSYNRRFQRKVGESWTHTLVPDYTITIRPSDMSEGIAAKMNKLGRIHLDAKYRSGWSNGISWGDVDKMNTYMDAVQHSIGSFVIHPFSLVKSQSLNADHMGIHEVGWFSMDPCQYICNSDESSDIFEKIRLIFQELVSKWQ